MSDDDQVGKVQRYLDTMSRIVVPSEESNWECMSCLHFREVESKSEEDGGTTNVITTDAVQAPNAVRVDSKVKDMMDVTHGQNTGLAISSMVDLMDVETAQATTDSTTVKVKANVDLVVDRCALSMKPLMDPFGMSICDGCSARASTVTAQQDDRGCPYCGGRFYATAIE